MNDAQKIAIAKRAAGTMFTTMAGIPAEIQLEAAILLTKSLFMAGVKPENRISLFNSVVQKMRKELQEHLKTGATNYDGYGPGNRRQDS